MTGKERHEDLRKLDDGELACLVGAGNSRAFLELARRYGPLTGAIIQRINRTWITQQVLADATWKTLDSVARNLCASVDPGSANLKSLVEEWADSMAILLWRAWHTPEGNGNGNGSGGG